MIILSLKTIVVEYCSLYFWYAKFWMKNRKLLNQFDFIGLQKQPINKLYVISGLFLELQPQFI